jgi:competence protein ComEC
LKIGHHGSKTSTSDIFLSAVSPKYGVISADKNNSYGHPHADVVERLKDFDIKILETSKDGNITFRSDGISIRVK